MSLRSWVVRRRRGLASTTTLSVLSSAFVVAAALSDGVAVPDVALDDGSVWVTKSSELLVGKLNRQVDELTSGLRAGSSDMDVLQDGPEVLVHDRGLGQLRPVDVAYAALGRETALPEDAQVALGGTTVTVLRPADGALWVRTTSSVAALSAEDEEPDAVLGAGALAVVGADGTAHALSVERDEVVSLRPGGAPEAVALTADVPDDPGAADLTAVGGRAVVLDRGAGRLQVPGEDARDLDDADRPLLQQAGPAASSVLVATGDAVLEVPLAGGSPVRTAAGGDGAPARPVRVGDCLHAAWTGSGRYATRCGDGDARVVDVSGAAASTTLVFRVNRRVVVLNDLRSGNVWLLDDAMTLVSDWTDVTPPEDESDDEQQDALQEQVEAAQAERDQPNRAPEAADEDLGVRPGRTTLLPVLDNDSDPDGDLLTLSLRGPDTVLGGSARLVRGGTGVQLDVPADATGSAELPYEVSDGRGGTAVATARVTVRTPDENGAPEQLRRSTAVVRLGGTVTARVLQDFRDPDGDDLVLEQATATTADAVRFQPDGTVVFADAGLAPGRKTVELVVSDGRERATGQLVVDVRPAGLPPVAATDHVVTTVGQTATVRPLLNDVDPDGDELRLATVTGPADVQLEVDHLAGTFTALSAREGTTYLTYVVTDGPGSSTGLVRLDVLPAAGENRPPAAVRDLALLPDGGRVLVDVLANDEDPDGDVLVVQSVSGAAEAGVQVAVLGHAVLRVSAARALTGPVVVGYTVSDGLASAAGSVVVVPVPRPAQQQPPTAVPDTVTVRAGDVVTVPVLANDSHPDGDDLVLLHELAQDVPAGRGLLFVDGSVLRYQAPDEPGTVQALYAVADSQGQTASTQVTFYVRAADDTNAAPQPRPVTARALAGGTTRIPVPLAGTDPDGDSVRLLGVATAPTKGRVVETAPDALVYEAFAGSSGTDLFTYAVADRRGARATAQVRVGIAARGTNADPVAVDDRAVVRTGRSATVLVLANDSDPDGDPVRLGDPALEVPAGVEARVSGDAVVVRADRPTTTLSYAVEDGRAGRATGFVTVEARDDAPLLPPLARDDVVTDAQAAGRTTVDVPVLDNDADPDGPEDALELGLSDRAASSASVAGRGLRVALTAAPQVLAYSVTDGDGLRAWAFVHVPGTDSAAPALAPGAALEVPAGGAAEVRLADVVVVRSGRTPRLTAVSSVSATNADGAPLVVDETTLRYAPAAGFSGPASLVFEVTDGAGPDDPAGRTAVLTLPVTVTPGENRPPAWRGAAVQVAPGEEAAVVDLAGAVEDPDPDDAGRLRFSAPGAVPAGLQVRLDGSRLSVSAAADVAKGTSATLALQVTDGSTPAVEAPVTVTVTASTRPLAKAVDDVVADADQGRAVTVEVLANDANPFPGTPLRLAPAVVVESGSGRAVASGDRVEVTPAGDFVGTLVVRYGVLDATGDPDRQVEGRVRLTVRGRPGTPSTPTVLEVRDRTVVLTWSAPQANGAPITGYRVDGGGYSRECPGTTCTLDGLTNDVEYRFTVTARNAVGESDPSPASAPARPDVRPDRPTPPSLVFGDRSLQVSWTPPSSPGSRIEQYELEISPPAAGGTQAVATGTTYTWTGLTNGQAYQVRLRARNRAPEPSDWSDYSRPEVPAGVPETPAAPTAAPAGGTIGGQVTVRWTRPDENGAAVDRYELQVFKGGALERTLRDLPGSATETTVTADNANDYTFRVVAVNKAGPSAPSPASASVRPFGQPSAVASVQASEQDRRSTLAFSPPSDNGKAIARYEYRANGGAPATLAADRVVTGLTNGTTYRFEVRACNDYCGDWSPPSNAVVPYGPVGQPAASAAGGATTVTFSWSPPAPNGRPLDRLEISVNGGGWERVAPSPGSRTVGNGHDQTWGIRVKAFDTAGQAGPEASASARTSPPPQPTATLIRDRSAVGQPGCTHSSCRFLDFSVSNFPAGRYQVCANADNDPNYFCQTRDVPANGRVNTDIYYGFPGRTVWLRIGSYETNRVVW